MKRLALFLILLTTHTNAAESYSRAIELEWDRIEGALKYEVEWIKGKDCQAAARSSAESSAKSSDESSGTDVSASPVWSKRLPAGVYCVRVRGLGAGDRPGQWTEPEKLAVRPKAPRGLKRSGESLVWDKVPYANGYSVELLSPQGKPLHSAQVKNAELKLDPKWVPQELRSTALRYRIRTRVDGLPDSVSAELSFPFELPIVAQVQKPSIIPLPKPKPKPKVMAPQPPAEALLADEAIARYRLTGEKPLPPEGPEWAAAKTLEQRENLRRRTLASARIELLEREARLKAPDLRLRFGPELGFNYFFQGDPAAVESQGITRGVGAKLLLEVDGYRSRPWGGYFRFSRRHVGAPESASENTAEIARETSGLGVVEFAGGAERNYSLDPLGESAFSWRIGLSFLTLPLVPDDSGSSENWPVAAAGFDLGAGHRFQINSAWSFESRLGVQLFAPQNLPGATGRSLSGYGAMISLGPTFQVLKELGVGAAYRLSASVLGIDGIGIPYKLQLVESGLVFQGVYRVSPLEERRPAAELALRSRNARLIQGSVSTPLGFRGGVLAMRSGTGGTVQESLSGVATGFLVGGSSRLSRTSPWSGGLELGFARVSSSEDAREPGIEGGVALLAQYETPVFQRRDLVARLGGGLGVKSTAAGSGTDAKSVIDRSALVRAQLERSFTDRITSRVKTGFELPLSVSYEGGAEKSPSFEGTPYAYSVGAEAGFHLNREITIWGGYGYRRAQMGTALEGERLTLNFFENQFGVGAEFSW